MLRDVSNTQGTKVVVAPPLAASTPLLLPKTLAIKKIPHNLLINANVSITRSFFLFQLIMIRQLSMIEKAN